MTKLKLYTYLTIAAAAVTPAAHALFETETGVFYIDVTGSATWDTNVFTNSEEMEDLILRLVPSLNYIQDRGLVHMTASASTSFNEYADFDAQSGNDYFLDVNFTGMHRSPNPAGDFSFGASYADQSIASEEVATRIDITDVDLNGSFSFDLSDKTGLRFSGGWGERDYEDAAFEDSEDIFGRADFLYAYSEKLNLKVGYRYRDISYDVRDLNTDTFIVGAEGVFSEKLSGSVEVGGSEGDELDGVQFYYALGLDWAADANTSFSIDGKRDNGTSALAARTTSTRITARVAQRFTNLISGTAYAGIGRFEREDITERDDDILYLGAGIASSIIENGSIFATIDYQDRSSNADVSDYARFLITLGLNQQF